MGTLHDALAWAARGFQVFPLVENDKEPALPGDWTDGGTSDPAIIKALWTNPLTRADYNYNIGCVCTGMVVVDIDIKKGKQGVEEYAQMGGHYDTLVVRTASGGYHCYFDGPNSSNEALSPGVDVRSNRGYVVAPGSTINGVRYDIVNDRDMQPVPEPIGPRLKAPKVRSDAERNVDLEDSPAAIDGATRFLQSAPVAVEGMHGDDTTFQTAARLVREMALSASAAYYLMLEHWNPRCVPPWDPDDLWRKVENAYNYGTANVGRLSPEVMFASVKVTPPPTVFQQNGVSWGNAIWPDFLEPRPWLVKRMLMRGAVTLLLAAGSAGKSSISLAIAAHLAVGKNFAGYTATGFNTKTIVYNGEDDLQEQSRRLYAVCESYGLNFADVSENIMLLSSRELKLQLVTKENNRPVRNDIIIKQLIEKASEPDVGLLIIDPLVKVHQCDESDNVQMDVVMDTLTDIGYYANVSVLALHHVNKGNSRHEERIGSMDISRGASAIVNAARIAFTLLSASNQDIEDYGIMENERHRWVRMDDAKMNLSLAGTEATWFHKDSITLTGQNESVGVMRYSRLEKSKTHIRDRIAVALLQSFEAMGAGQMSLNQAVGVLRSETIWSSRTDADVKRTLEGLFMTAVTVRGATIKIERDKNDPDGKARVVLS